ncbi:MAG: hypothetical protein QXO02_08255 [Thermofilaceae archaeon]
MSYLRLLAWLTALIITLGAVLSMLPRETRLPSSRFMFPNLDTQLTGEPVCVNETTIYPDVDSLNLYFDGDDVKRGGEKTTNESLLPIIRGDVGFVDPALYYKSLATYLALFPVGLGVESKRYVVAPLPYGDQGEGWVGERTLCLTYPWLHVNPVEPLLLSNTSSVGVDYVESPVGVLTTTRLALTYLPSFNIAFNHSIVVYENNYVHGYAYSSHSATVTDIEEKECYLNDDTLYCIKVYAYKITWYYYLALYNSTSWYSSISNIEEYVYNPLSGELYVERTMGNFMGYALARVYLRARPVVYYYSNESHIEVIYDAVIESGYASRGVKALSYRINGYVSYTPYTGLNPVLKLNNAVISVNPYPVSMYVDALNPARGTLLFTAEDVIELYNDLTYLGTARRGVNVTRRAVQLNITYDTLNPVVEITREFTEWRGDAYIKPGLNITLINPPMVNITAVRESLSPHPGEYWLAKAYANATAKTIESVVKTISEYKDAYRYLLSAMILSSTMTIENNASADPVLAIRDVLVTGKGSPSEKTSVLSMVLSELRVEHELKNATTRYAGMSKETPVILAYINDIPGLWQLPVNLYEKTGSRYIVLYDPWQNTVFCNFELVMHEEE